MNVLCHHPWTRRVVSSASARGIVTRAALTTSSRGIVTKAVMRHHPSRLLTPSSSIRTLSSSTVYQFTVPPEKLEVIQSTLPAVAEAGTDLTKHFYRRMFANHSELLNLFNQTNQAVGGQPKKLLKTIAVAAQASLETGELPGEVIEGVCQKHAALDIQPEAYSIVGENLLGTISELLTDDPAVLEAWGALYGDIVTVFVTREQQIKDEAAATPGGWVGRRAFILEKKERLSETIQKFTFAPTDGGPTPIFQPGKYTTVWTQVPSDSSGIHGQYQEQPRHYTLGHPATPEEATKSLSISVKKQGLVSSILHEAPIGTTFDLSAPFGCFDLSGVETLWLSEENAPVVFLSGGIGVTPVLAMLENIYVTRPATWLHASESGAVHAYRDRLRHISAVRLGELQRRVWYSDPTADDGPPGGKETDPILYNLAKYHYEGYMDLNQLQDQKKLLHLDNPLAQYYMCGPPGFMTAQREALQQLGVDDGRIHWEGFG